MGRPVLESGYRWAWRQEYLVDIVLSTSQISVALGKLKDEAEPDMRPQGDAND